MQSLSSDSYRAFIEAFQSTRNFFELSDEALIDALGYDSVETYEATLKGDEWMDDDHYRKAFCFFSEKTRELKGVKMEYALSALNRLRVRFNELQDAD
jgi:hypothetical protein